MDALTIHLLNERRKNALKNAAVIVPLEFMDGSLESAEVASDGRVVFEKAARNNYPTADVQKSDQDDVRLFGYL